MQLDLFAEAGINPAWGDPASSGYIEAERMPEDWRGLIGHGIPATRRAVGSIADCLEVMPADWRDEWRRLIIAAEAEETGSECNRALEEWEERHGLVWDAYGQNMMDVETGEWIVEQW